MSDDPSSTSASGRFPTTAWGVIQAAQDRAHAEQVLAMNQLIGRYWKPVFCFLRARGYDLHRAEDLTQAFFLRFLERDWLQKADPDRGRFRTFLLTILVRFLSDQGPRRAPRQQAFEQQFASIASLLGDEERSYEPPGGETAEAIFMKQWAAVLVETVRQQLRRLCEEKGRPIWYDLFDAVHGAASGTGDPSQHALADRFGLTREQFRYGLEQARQWFASLLRAEVREQVGAEADVGAEIRELLALLAAPSLANPS